MSGVSHTALIASYSSEVFPANYRARGTYGVNAGDLSVALPSSYAENDILLLFAQVRPGQGGDLVTPAGYTLEISEYNSISDVCLFVFWKRASNTETAPVLTGTLQFHAGAMVAVSGCPTTGNPFHVKDSKISSPASSAYETDTLTTTENDTLIFACFASGTGTLTVSGWSNATEIIDEGHTTGTQSSLHVGYFQKPIAGAVSAETATASASAFNASAIFALKSA